MPVTASIIGASIGGAQTAFGAYQYLQGRQMAKKAMRPEMDIPREISEKLSTAQMMALEGMSAEERKQYIDNLQRVANFQMSEMGTRKAGLVGAAELGQTQADAVRNLAVESEKMRRENQRYLGATESEMAGWKQQQFETNKMQPYMAQATAAQAMQGAGLQNIYGGAGSAGKNVAAAGMYSSLTPPTKEVTSPFGTGVGLDQNTTAPNVSQGLSSIPSPQLSSNDSAQLQALKVTNPDLYMQIMSGKINKLNFSY